MNMIFERTMIYTPDSTYFRMVVGLKVAEE